MIKEFTDDGLAVGSHTKMNVIENKLRIRVRIYPTTHYMKRNAPSVDSEEVERARIRLEELELDRLLYKRNRGLATQLDLLEKSKYKGGLYDLRYLRNSKREQLNAIAQGKEYTPFGVYVPPNAKRQKTEAATTKASEEVSNAVKLRYYDEMWNKGLPETFWVNLAEYMTLKDKFIAGCVSLSFYKIFVKSDPLVSRLKALCLYTRKELDALRFSTGFDDSQNEMVWGYALFLQDFENREDFFLVEDYVQERTRVLGNRAAFYDWGDSDVGGSGHIADLVLRTVYARNYYALDWMLVQDPQCLAVFNILQFFANENEMDNLEDGPLMQHLWKNHKTLLIQSLTDTGVFEQRYPKMRIMRVVWTMQQRGKFKTETIRMLFKLKKELDLIVTPEYKLVPPTAQTKSEELNKKIPGITVWDYIKTGVSSTSLNQEEAPSYQQLVDSGNEIWEGEDPPPLGSFLAIIYVKTGNLRWRNRKAPTDDSIWATIPFEKIELLFERLDELFESFPSEIIAEFEEEYENKREAIGGMMKQQHKRVNSKKA